ncbi:FAD-binding oxidoreductase [Aspergillus ibericus CBS 121593]|uniref:FAD-binding domain-containing protein n=1 Tax=Aspergillus ibericus CBS 121593 TaxID=1448316 RepID=A0A395GK99_9EURO|nr:FAD-binding domain-containing protein [Aspergillus ibericus CBS 121593]RAK95915.1 FAD-binding domain-containing protein [Aspergillus ibericus CBS 121593]
MASTTQLTALEAFVASHPTIRLTPPTSPDFPAARQIFHAGRRAQPLAIAHPQTPADVAALVKYAKAHALPFSVRSGGHNLEGLSVHDGALLIDLRALTAVTVAADRQSATVQGGILQHELASKLWVEGLGTPTGAIPDVGYIGWATYGGYGAFSSHWGLGVDQILAATIVNPEGEIISADEPTLQGIRGAGGLFGIILDLTIKVYPLPSLFAGAIMYDSTNIAQTLVTYNAAYQTLLDTDTPPPQLTVQQIAFNSPHGRIFGVIFTWSGPDLEEGHRWSEKIASLAPVIMNTVAPTTIPEWFAGNGALVPKSMYGAPATYNVRRITTALAEVIGRYLEIMPDNPGTMLSIHQARGVAVGEEGRSVFAAREPHYMLEIVGFVTGETGREGSEDWAEGMAREVRELDEGNLLSTAYLSLMKTEGVDAEEVLKRAYGEKAGLVRQLKRRVDPENVFALTVPRLK